jgi:hypothetical protein
VEPPVTPAPPGRLDLWVSAGRRYSSNPRFQGDLEEFDPDSISELRADLSGGRTTDRTAWSLRYRPAYTRYRDRENQDLDTAVHALEADGSFLLSRRVKLGFLQRFVSTRDPGLVERPGTGETTVLTRQGRRWVDVSDASLEIGVSPLVSLVFGAGARIDRFEDPAFRGSDQWTGRAGAGRRVGRQDSILGSYTFSRYQLGDDGSADSDSHTLDATWTHGAPGTVELRFSGGWSRLVRADEHRDRITGSASLSKPFRRIRFASGYRRTLTADTGADSVTLAQGAYAGFSGRAGRRVDLGIFGDFGTRDSVLESGEEVRLRVAGASLRGDVTLHPRVVVRGEANRREQDDRTDANIDVTANTFFLGIVLQLF